MNWFHELIAALTRLFGGQPMRKQTKATTDKKLHGNMPPKTVQTPERQLPEKSEGGAEARIINGASSLEQKEPLRPVYTTETKIVSERYSDIQQPVVVPSVASALPGELGQTSLPQQESYPWEKKSDEEQVPGTVQIIENSKSPGAVENPERLPEQKIEGGQSQTIEMHPAYDMADTDEGEQSEQKEDVQTAFTEESAIVQQIADGELELFSPKNFYWQKEQNEEFTLWPCQQEGGNEEASKKEVARLRLTQKTSLHFPLSEDKNAWIQNAIQASDLILLPFRAQRGITKTFVTDGLVTTLWEVSSEKKQETWFAAAILTKQMAYIVIGSRTGAIDLKELAECWHGKGEGTARTSSS